MKNRIATSIEQSKKLLELGLDPRTADMSYTNYKFQTDNNGNLISDSCEPVGGLAVGNMFDDYPAWSLSALLELMPQRIYLNGAAHQFQLDRNWDKVTWQCAYDAMNSYIEQKDLSPLDAAYSMVVWLIEQGYIKTEKK